MILLGAGAVYSIIVLWTRPSEGPALPTVLSLAILGILLLSMTFGLIRFLVQNRKTLKSREVVAILLTHAALASGVWILICNLYPETEDWGLLAAGVVAGCWLKGCPSPKTERE